MLLSKSKANSIEVLLSKALIDSVISHEEFVLINNMLKEYNEMKGDFIEDFSLFIKQNYSVEIWSVEKIQKWKTKSCKDKKRRNNAFIILCSM